MRKTLLVAAILGLTLAACAEPAEEASADPTETAWVLESGTLNGEAIPLVETHPITLVFEANGEAGGTSACNSYGSTYTISGTEITFGLPVSTMMACTPEEVMDSEAAYLEALPLVNGFSATKDSLTLTGEDVELVFGVDESV